MVKNGHAFCGHLGLSDGRIGELISVDVVRATKFRSKHRIVVPLADGIGYIKPEGNSLFHLRNGAGAVLMRAEGEVT